MKALPPVSLAEAQGRARAAILAHPHLWGDGEGEPDEEIRDRLAEVDAVTSIGSLVETLALDTFEGE